MTDFAEGLAATVDVVPQPMRTGGDRRRQQTEAKYALTGQ